MEYIFGYEEEYGEVLKVISPKDITLERGQTIIERNYSDQIITDSFYIIERVREKEDTAGNKYVWFKIKNHYRYTDKFTPGIKETEQEITEQDLANIEAEQMLTDLDLRVTELEARNA